MALRVMRLWLKQEPAYNIQGSMAVVATLTPLTAESMCGKAVRFSSPMVTWMWTRELPNEAPLALWWCHHPCAGPEDGIGSTSSQAPKSFVIEVSKRARVLGSGAFSKRASAQADAFKVSQAVWRYWATPSGGARLCPAALAHHPHKVLESPRDEVGQ